MATLTVQPDETASKDIYVYSEAPTTSGAGQLKLGYVTGKVSQTARALIEFDISTLPSDAYVTDVTITLHINSNFINVAGNDFTIYRTLFQDWDETASWNYQSGTTWWTNADGSKSTSPTYTGDQGTGTFSLTDSETGAFTVSGSGLVDMVNDAISFRGGKLSMLLKSDDEATSGYVNIAHSGNATASKRPKVEVTYQTSRVFKWTGDGGDGSLATAGNWDLNEVPGQYDTVHFSDETASDATVGTLTCDNFHVSRFFDADIGGSVSAVTVNCNKAVIEKDNGRTNISFNTVSGTTDKVFIKRIPQADGYTTIGGNITTLFVSGSRAHVKIPNSSTVGTVYAAPRSNGGAAIEFGTNINADLVAIRGSRIKSASGLDDITLVGGSRLEITTEAGDTASGNIVLHRATLLHNGVTTAGGSLTIYSGVYDLRDSVVGQHTIASIDMFDGTLDARNGIGSFNSSSVTGTWNYYGGQVLLDPGTTVDI